MNIWFDLPSLYYWPQYEPVYQELVKRGHSCQVAVHENDRGFPLAEKFFNRHSDVKIRVIDGLKLSDFYRDECPDWIILGNDNLSDLSALAGKTKTALLYHGIGVKACYYSPGLARYNVRFTEGRFRQQQLARMFPDGHFQEVGFAKLDPLFNGNCESINLHELGLSDSKPTIVYAPTFYPSSIERMPSDWPGRLSDFNIIIKPHFSTWSMPKYAGQRRILLRWNEYDNVYLAPADDISLVPYFKKADVLISEASSALFEFAALDKPVIWLDYLNLRWSYRGIFSYRYKKRMDNTIDSYRDVAVHVASPKKLEETVREQMMDKGMYSMQRKRTTNELIGNADGQVSVRIANYLEKNVAIPMR